MRHPQEKTNKASKNSSTNNSNNKDTSNIQITTNYFSNQAISMSNNKPLVTSVAQDKRLQELREFALEYVKQIVLKANELSHDRYEVRKACQQQQMEDGASRISSSKVVFQVSDQEKGDKNSNGVFLTPIEATDAISERLEHEAGEINKRFKLAPANKAALVENKQQAKRVKGSRQIHYEPSNESHHESGNRIDKVELCQDREQIVRNYQNAPSSAHQNQGISSQQDYIEEAEASISRDSQSKQQQQQRQHDQNQNQHHHQKRSKRGFYHRLNWHLLVACFSTCLPQSMTDRIPSSMSSGGASGVSASATAV